MCRNVIERIRSRIKHCIQSVCWRRLMAQSRVNLSILRYATALSTMYPINEFILGQIDGDVFDVSSNRKTYGPGGSYHALYDYDSDRNSWLLISRLVRGKTLLVHTGPAASRTISPTTCVASARRSYRCISPDHHCYVIEKLISSFLHRVCNIGRSFLPITKPTGK